jgi:2-polyprenyl-6-methoxyphenol hydroxylase-like FAD-dependent oxidoreductase
MPNKTITTDFCIAGGGPAGIVLGYLLARAGIKVTVLEKWPDFFRDFRGDTIHPSTMDILGELGLLEGFLKLPHNEIKNISIFVAGQEVKIADFSHIKAHCQFVALTPQWDFLNFISAHAKQYPGFDLHMETEATDVILENGRVVGIKAKSKTEEFEVRAQLVVGADGRHSTIHEKSDLVSAELGVPIDVLWFKLSRLNTDMEQSGGNLDSGKFMVMLDRGDYWQCALVINKGKFDEFKNLGLPHFHSEIETLVPFLKGRTQEILGWEQIKLLSVTVDCLEKWYRPGLVCIGDAAHAMSPIGGVGINLAIQDAVAAANILIPSFKQGTLGLPDLAAIQKRREGPTRKTQRLQVFLQNHIISPILNSKHRVKMPLFLKLVRYFPYLTRIPARLLGVGFGPEHIDPKLFAK